MGTDIHIVVEERVGESWLPVRMLRPFTNEYARKNTDDTLHHFASPVALARNYDRFAKLAGVRGDGPKPEGFPTDVHPATKHFLEVYGGAHSQSWTPLREALEIFLETDEGLDEFDKQYSAYYYFSLETLGPGSDDVFKDKFRIVYNFDS